MKPTTYRRAVANRIAALSAYDQTCRRYAVPTPAAVLDVLDALTRDHDVPGSVGLDRLKVLIQACEQSSTDHVKTRAGTLYPGLPWLAQQNALSAARSFSNDVFDYWFEFERAPVSA